MLRRDLELSRDVVLDLKEGILPVCKQIVKTDAAADENLFDLG